MLPEGNIPPSLLPFGDLLSPLGLVSRVQQLPSTEGEPRYPIYTGSLGNPGEVLGTQKGWSHDPNSGNFDGAGGDIDKGVAAYLSIAESLERYASISWDPDHFVWASATEMGEDGIAPAQWPNCSENELRDPRSGLVSSDPRIPIRWVKSWSLTRNKAVYVPAVQVYLKITPESAAERYTHPVSTGCAAHTDPIEAVKNGILEVVERDSIALTWLQELPLPEIEIVEEDLNVEHQDFWQKGQSPFLKTRFFDATTDLGIPVIYGLQLADNDEKLATLVAATCDLNPSKAIAKLLRESASLRIALRSLSNAYSDTMLNDPEDTISVFGGAILNGKLANRPLYNFLLENKSEKTTLAKIGRNYKFDNSLHGLVNQLALKGCEVLVVDLTTDEARAIGAHVVRVLIPQLMPLSFVHRARYLGHPRLYEAPIAMGHESKPEEKINPNLQPFA
ncbi:MAG: YcaO-like family protein [Corynebacterium sp.]|uniref:YcaO-like family protein n=1 Tax=Corynebacterium sp. TaxID=1720 RepID=UPI0026DB5CD5|nr:YcaO-like family protein [Corynebacterium sp.]MDO5099893.1 YcaO-like family protein [Corynebacterium sp.]